VPGAVVRRTDRAFGMERTEIVCGNCGGHLGHVFKGEGYPTSTDERHCVNSVSIKFDDKAEAAAKDEAKTVEAKGETAKV
jgi:peptide-methionine (R)-S-oxide reductase